MRLRAQLRWMTLLLGASLSFGLPLPTQAQDAWDSLLSAQPQVDAAVLDEQRGGADTTTNTVMNDIHASGVVSDNQAYNLTTGSNSIAGGAFTGANGLSTVVQNSGNNVLIQNSTIINIQLQ